MTPAAEERQKIKAGLMEVLDKLDTHVLDLSPDSEEYDLHYISKKLAACTHHQEQLSTLLLNLTRVNLAVTNMNRGASTALELKSRQLKDSEDYKCLPRDEKSTWLAGQLQNLREEADAWIDLRKAVSEVREAVAERASTMKRLDSDLRLHSKLYETKVSQGAIPRPTYSANPDDDIDLG